MMKCKEISSLCVSGDLCILSTVLLWFVDHGATSLHSLSSKSLSCLRCSTVNNHFWRRSKHRLINFSWLLLFSLSKFNLLFATSEGLMMMMENTDNEFFRVWAMCTISKNSSFGMCKISCSIYNLIYKTVLEPKMPFSMSKRHMYYMMWSTAAYWTVWDGILYMKTSNTGRHHIFHLT